jgi:protein Mpv17
MKGMLTSTSTADEEIKTVDQIEFERNFAFILYGGLYQGIAQYFIYNVMFPLWFGPGSDITSVAVKVAFDMLVISPFLCLPIAYLTKATIYGQSWTEGLTKYKYDFIKKNLLGKYCSIWVPAQFCTFGLIPEHLRIPFIAVISFFWLIILSTVSSAEMESEESNA